MTIALMMSLIVRFGGVVGEAAADGVSVAAARADFAVPVSTWVVDGLESAAAEGATVDVVVRLAPAVDFATLVRSVLPALWVPARFGELARPLPPTVEPVLPCADDVESLPVESACATPVAPGNAVQIPTARALIPTKFGSLL
ncbi:hypothetical protein AB431_22330 [Mycobacterium sp. EPa45]|nr:hypothetical protein AB431_22330 [Mycobacterium sp. EPa45]